MSNHTDALRDIAANHGWPVCDLAADKLEDHEKAYALLFAENAKLRKELESERASMQSAPVAEPFAWHKRFGSDISIVPASTFVAEDAIATGWQPLFTAPQSAADAMDAKRLDWLERAGDVAFNIVVDAPHDGEFSLYTDVTSHDTMYGKTLREAIDAAIAQAEGSRCQP